MPLNVAAAIVYRAFVTDGEPAAQTEDELERRIDEAAYAVALAIPIYRMDLADPLEIAAATLAEGVFAAGACELRFPDGRPTLDALAVYRTDLDHVLARRRDLVPETRPEALMASRLTRPRLGPKTRDG